LAKVNIQKNGKNRFSGGGGSKVQCWVLGFFQKIDFSKLFIFKVPKNDDSYKAVPKGEKIESHGAKISYAEGISISSTRGGEFGSRFYEKPKKFKKMLTKIPKKSGGTIYPRKFFIFSVFPKIIFQKLTF
jgi:hypothetical protein